MVVIYRLEGAGEFWFGHDKIYLIPPPPPAYKYSYDPHLIASQFNFPPPHLYTLLATTDPFSVPLEHHVIPKFPQSPPQGDFE